MTPVYIDAETRGPLNLKDIGVYRYAVAARVLILVYAVADGPVQTVSNGGKPLTFADLPDELRRLWLDPEHVFVAWNCGFDRAVLNYALDGAPYLPPERFVDAMAVAAASNLPLELEQASKTLGHQGKLGDGKRLIKKFSDPDADPVDESDPDWILFLDYAARDIVAMRDVWAALYELPVEEWQVFWVSERVNERGIASDLEFCERASALAAADKKRLNARLAELTGGELRTVDQTAAIARYVFDRIDAEGRDIMQTKLPGEDDSDPDAIEKVSLSIDKQIVARLLGYLRSRPVLDTHLVELLELREAGGFATPKKFGKILGQEVDGRLRGQFLFNGATQTGRFSSRGVQIQNLSRAPLGGDYGDFEEPSIVAIMDGCSLDQLHKLGDGEFPSRKLAQLIRPAFIAAAGRTLVKGDYAQIEARVLPFLATGEAAESALDNFRAIDRGERPDLYTTTAAVMFGLPLEEVTKELRQAGKISTLSCGFGGGHAALLSMAAKQAKPIFFTETEAREIVALWRQANPFAPAFWGKHDATGSYGLWGAALRAYAEPGQVQKAGRIEYVFEPNYLDGTLVAVLPSGRLLFYPACRWRLYEKRDKKTKQVVSSRETLVFRRAKGFVGMWPGLLCENVVQAYAADLLRHALVAIDPLWPIVAHAHDEITLEVDEADAEAAKADLVRVMSAPKPWNQGLPLVVEATARWWYSSAKPRTVGT